MGAVLGSAPPRQTLAVTWRAGAHPGTVTALMGAVPVGAARFANGIDGDPGAYQLLLGPLRGWHPTPDGTDPRQALETALLARLQAMGLGVTPPRPAR